MKSTFKIIFVLTILNISNRNCDAQTWNLVGNTGTDPNTQFIGTIDNKALKIRTNNTVRVTITSAGKLGIGNTSPVFKLDVKGGSINTDSVYRINGVQVLKRDTLNTIQIGDATAKVGIGTAAPVNTLEVTGNSAITGSFVNTGTGNNDGLLVSCNNTPGTGTGLRAFGGGFGVFSQSVLFGTGDRVGVLANGANGTFNYGLYSTSFGGTEAYGIYSSASGATTNWAGYFKNGNVYAENNVGIGTTSPSVKLDVAGSIKAYDSYFTNSSGGHAISLGTSGGSYGSIGYGLIYTGVTNSYQYKVTDFSSMLNFNGGGFDFNTAPSGITGNTITYTPAMKILQNGNTGIGVSSPGARLHIKGGGSTNTTSALSVQSANSQQLFLVQDGGRVGIGTSSLTLAGFHTQVMVGNTVALFRGGSNSKGISIIADSPGIYFNSYYNGGTKAMAASGFPAVISGNQTNGSLTFSTTDVANTTAGAAVTVNERMRISGNGFIGVGTTTPNVDFHLIHNSLATGSGSGLRIQCIGSGNYGWTFHALDQSQYFDLHWGGFNGGVGGTVTFIDGTSGNWIGLSDAKFKKDIVEVVNILPELQKLKLLKYHFNSQKSVDRKYFGMIAQEVQKVFPEIVYEHKNEMGEPFLGMNYSAFGLIAIKGIQELKEDVDERDKVIAFLKTENEEMKKRMDAFDKSLEQCCMHNNSLVRISGLGEPEVALLEQNSPNPFTQNTTIQFYLPQNAVKAFVKIYSLDGVEIKSFTSNQKGINEITVGANSLAAGVYVYTLVVDGKAVDTKQMVLTK